MHTSITRPPKCRWCDKQPEFAPVPADTALCPHCDAIQDPVLRLRGPAGRVAISFYVNPDDSVFVEVEKRDTTARYEFSPEQLSRAGSFLRTPLKLDGKRIDKPLSGGVT